MAPHSLLLAARELGSGGSERQMTELALALDPAEFTVHVACFHAGGFRSDQLRRRGVSILDLPVRSFVSWSAVRGAWKLGRYLRRHRIHLVHTFDLPLTCFGVPVARISGVPIVLSSQRADRSLQPRYRRLARWTDRRVDGIVVNCEAMRRYLIADEGVPERLIHVCYNWIDTGQFHPQPRLRPGALAAAPLVIGVVCVLRPEKDLVTLLEAFARVSNLMPGLLLVIVGSGPMLDPLQARARELGILSRCLFQPEVPEVTAWLREIDIFVLPSRSEALSNALMEAMACGCCPVASGVGGNPELVSDGQTGLLFRCGDAGDLADKLGRLIGEPETRARLGAAAAEFIRSRFDREASVTRMEEVYRTYLKPCIGKSLER